MSGEITIKPGDRIINIYLEPKIKIPCDKKIRQSLVVFPINGVILVEGNIPQCAKIEPSTDEKWQTSIYAIDPYSRHISAFIDKGSALTITGLKQIRTRQKTGGKGPYTLTIANE